MSNAWEDLLALRREVRTLLDLLGGPPQQLEAWSASVERLESLVPKPKPAPPILTCSECGGPVRPNEFHTCLPKLAEERENLLLIIENQRKYMAAEGVERKKVERRAEAREEEVRKLKRALSSINATICTVLQEDRT